MNFIEPMWIAISTYSIFPAPIVNWNERNMRFSICYLPIIGLLIGGMLWLWFWLWGILGAGSLLFGAIATILPVLLSGGIHMDGFADTVDAVSSHQSRERKLEILKDSHCGAFAVIYCGIYFLTMLGLFSELHTASSVLIVGLGYVLSRCLAAVSAMTLPNARKSGMLAAFTDHLQKKQAMAPMLLLVALVAVAMLLVQPITGCCCLAAAGLTLLLYRSFALKVLGGVTGDTTGCFIQTVELSQLLAVVLCQLLMGVAG